MGVGADAIQPVLEVNTFSRGGLIELRAGLHAVDVDFGRPSTPASPAGLRAGY
jgi:hypothetical protein